MDKRIIVYIDGCGDEIDDPQVHSNSPSPTGEGILCGIMINDSFYENMKARNGMKVCDYTKKPITCKACIAALESAHQHKKINGKWY